MEFTENEIDLEYKINEEDLNNLIQTEFYDIKEDDLKKYKDVDIVQESLNTIKNYSLVLSKKPKQQKENTKKTIQDKNIIITQSTPSSEINGNNSLKKSLITKTIRSSSSFDENEASKKEIPVQYLQNPINFVDYLEYEQPKEEMTKIKNDLILKKYEEKNHTKFQILNIKVDDELNKVIFQPNELLTCIKYSENNLIAGDVLGEVKIFSLSDKKLLKILPCPIKSDTIIKVNAMDLTNDGKYIFIGYSNGNIAFFDLKTQKSKLLITDIVNCECLYIKFIDKEGKFFKIMVSSENGNVFLITFKDGVTGCRVVEKGIIYEEAMYPIYYIRAIEFNEKYLKRYSFLSNLEKYIVFVSLKSFIIYSLKKNSSVKKQFEIKNQTQTTIKNYFIGDISFGLGKDPQNRDILGEEDEDKPIILMCTSHDNILNLYLIAIDNGELTPPALVGHYININESGINQIIRIGFISKGAIYLIDKSNILKILNTKKLI